MTDPRSAFVVAVVDDDQSILRSLEYLLESADYAVRLF
jgi:FixJ family two-component response regulator